MPQRLAVARRFRKVSGSWCGAFWRQPLPGVAQRTFATIFTEHKRDGKSGALIGEGDPSIILLPETSAAKTATR